MIIHQIKMDVNNFQQLVPLDKNCWEDNILLFDGTPKENWKTLDVQVYNPTLPEGDFWNIGPGSFIISEKTYDLVGTQLEMAGQLLPLNCNGKKLFILNVLECVDCLNHEKTEWIYGEKKGNPISVKKYSFHSHLMPESSIFKLPRFKKGKIFTYEGVKDSEDEFKGIVESNNLKGIKFTKIWEESSEA